MYLSIQLGQRLYLKTSFRPPATRSKLGRLFIFVVFALLSGYGYLRRQHLPREPRSVAVENPTSSDLADAIKNHRSNVQVEGEGVVSRILPDDNDGSRHQKFLVRVGADQTVLIAHNIDLAPRLPSLKEGDTVRFNGEYEWNTKGGVVHWTHRDPAKRHPDGWLRHRGETIQ